MAWKKLLRCRAKTQEENFSRSFSEPGQPLVGLLRVREVQECIGDCHDDEQVKKFSTCSAVPSLLRRSGIYRLSALYRINLLLVKICERNEISCSIDWSGIPRPVLTK